VLFETECKDRISFFAANFFLKQSQIKSKTLIYLLLKKTAGNFISM